MYLKLVSQFGMSLYMVYAARGGMAAAARFRIF